MKRAMLIVVAAALVAAPAAAAHVTVTPARVPADSVGLFELRVPNEEAAANTTTISVRLPQGLRSLSVRAKSGWRRTVTRVNKRIATVTWRGVIRPGQAAGFRMSARVPDAPGRQLVFATVQRYSNGVVARWIGAPSADEPAPRVLIGRRTKRSGAAASTGEVLSTAGARTTPASCTGSSRRTKRTGRMEDGCWSTAELARLFPGVTASLGRLGLNLFHRGGS